MTAKLATICANALDAGAKKALLEAAGIPVQMRNANTQTLTGEISYAEAQPELWVSERDFPRAKEILEEARTKDANGPPVPCAQCGEENPHGYEVCWNCQVDLT